MWRLDFRFHEQRHTFTTRLAQAGVDLYRIQKLGRWKTLSMVLRYAYHCPDTLRPGGKALEKHRKNFITILSQLPDVTQDSSSAENTN